jgi:K(+)-stimulated pyrophosphate-energized sodium pump
MTELGLILGINLAGLAFAGLLVRWLSARDVGNAELRRVGGALQRAAESFLWRECRLIAIGTLVLVVVLLAAYGWRQPAGEALQPAFWSVVGVVLGAASSSAVAHFGARLAASASVRLLAAARTSLDQALSISVRAGGAAGLLAETMSALGTSALFALLYSMKGGFALGAEHAGPLALRAATLLPGYAVGAVAAALVIQRAGATYHASSDVAADWAGERDAGLEHDDARNPALVSDLVGDHVGMAATRTTDLFVSATLGNVAGVIVAASVYESNRDQLGGALAVVLLPIVVRAFGLIGSVFGVMVVRTTEETVSPAAALWRGHVTTLVVSLGGLAGAAYWLLGEQRFLRFVSAATIGVVITAAIAHYARLRAARRFAGFRDVLDAVRGGDATTVAQGLAAGLEAALLPTLAIGTGMVAAWQLGAGSGLVSGGMLAVTLALTTMLAGGPYVAILATIGPIADSARGVLAMSPQARSGDTEGRASRLDDAGFLAGAVAETYLVIVGCLTGLLTAAALPVLLGRNDGGSGVNLGKPVVAWCGALGAAAVLGYAGSAIRAATRGAQSVALEVERQLRGFPRERGLIQLPEGYTPSYRTIIDASTRVALERLMAPVAAALFVPAALGIGLKLLYHSADPGLASEGLASFVIVASVTGLTAALAVDAARVSLGTARRANRPRGAMAGFSASVTGDSVADLVGSSAAPAAHLLVKATAVGALAVAPFLS